MQRTNAFYIHVPWQRSMAALLRENAVKVCVLQTIDTNSRDLGSKLPILSRSRIASLHANMPSPMSQSMLALPSYSDRDQGTKDNDEDLSNDLLACMTPLGVMVLVESKYATNTMV
jgi:hypothetical protein